MSILIKDMEMPKNCMWTDDNHEVHSCPLLDGEDNCKLQDCKEEWNWADQYAGCPLVELPEHHSRIIDEDKIIVPSLSSWADQAIVADAIMDAPTIFEAERVN